MFRDEPYQGAFKAAAEATRARIRRDRARAPRALKRVFTIVSRRLFSTSLNAGEAFKAAGIKDCTLRAVFRKATGGTRLSRYIAKARIEVAHVLIVTTNLDLSSIGEMVGFTYHPTFANNYQREKDTLPSEVVRQPLTAPLIDDERSLKAGRGLLDDDEMESHIEDLMQIAPIAARRIRERICVDNSESQIMVDGARDDQLKAEGVWQEIRDLPFAEQCKIVRQYLFCSTVLFDLLRKKSLLIGRKSRQRAVEVAKLMLVSLEKSDQVFGERIHELRAFAWAWLGNAYQLALDFSAAVAAFERADGEWSKPRAQPDLLVLADICRLKGMLLMVRREYVQATEALDQSYSLFQQLDETRGEAMALIKRAAIHTYAGKLREAVEDFREAMGLIDEDQEKDLAYAAHVNLAATLVRAGEAENAAKELEQARELSRHIEDPVATIKLDWIEGDLRELQGDLEKAKRLYADVRTQFCNTEQSRYLGMVSVDLMAIHSQLGEWEKVGELAAPTLPLLTAMQLHSETIAAVDLLAEAVKAGRLSRRILRDLRAILRQDPLTV